MQTDSMALIIEHKHEHKLLWIGVFAWRKDGLEPRNINIISTSIKVKEKRNTSPFPRHLGPNSITPTKIK